jgi:glycine cleavage system H protein
MNFPTNLHYTEDHEWIRIDGEEAVIGITEFAVSELGDIVFLEIETQGEKLGKGDTFGTVEAVKTVSDLFMPIGGEVLEINTSLTDNPESVNKDPYGEGWLIKIKATDPTEVESLMNAEEYKKHIGE